MTTQSAGVRSPAVARAWERMPPVGSAAPDFALPDQHGGLVRLADFRGRSHLVVVFFPFAFTPTCSGELATVRDEGADFGRPDVATVAVSCDPGPALRAFAEQQRLGFPLLSDFWPHGAVSSAYGVFQEERGIALRGTFVVDSTGRVRWRTVEDVPDARDAGDYRRALADLPTVAR